jgi:hypothetical protein
VTPPPPLSATQRAADARRREQRCRKNASDKRERGETLLASLFERSADAQAALARLAEGLIVDDAEAWRGVDLQWCSGAERRGDQGGVL